MRPQQAHRTSHRAPLGMGRRPSTPGSGHGCAGTSPLAGSCPPPHTSCAHGTRGRGVRSARASMNTDGREAVSRGTSRRRAGWPHPFPRSVSVPRRFRRGGHPITHAPSLPIPGRVAPAAVWNSPPHRTGGPDPTVVAWGQRCPARLRPRIRPGLRSAARDAAHPASSRLLPVDDRTSQRSSSCTSVARWTPLPSPITTNTRRTWTRTARAVPCRVARGRPPSWRRRQRPGFALPHGLHGHHPTGAIGRLEAPLLGDLAMRRPLRPSHGSSGQWISYRVRGGRPHREAGRVPTSTMATSGVARVSVPPGPFMEDALRREGLVLVLAGHVWRRRWACW